MNWAVYWQQEDEIECCFFKTEEEARAHVQALISECEDLSDVDGTPDWEITLLRVIGEVREVAFDGRLALEEKR